MDATSVTLYHQGQPHAVPAYFICGRPIVFQGRFFKVASIFDEEWQNDDLVDPPPIIAQLIQQHPSVDCFTFSQSFIDTRPRHAYPFVQDNIAAIPTPSFAYWWDQLIGSDLRKDIRKSEKLGVVVTVVPFTDALVTGIKAIYDETPLRQGRPFWHYQKSPDRVKAENASYLERAVFLGAYVNDTLIGFIKIVRCGPIARMMQILTLESHFEYRPGNALIAAAVKWSAENGYAYLTYGKYTYYNKRHSSVVMYKRRNGFLEILFPRYYIPLHHRGRIGISLGLHLGYRRFLPESLTERAKKYRQWWRDR